jgi:hypothetical protein
LPVTSPVFDDQLPGCTVTDNFTQVLGNKNESLLAAAIGYAETDVCTLQNKPANKPKNKSVNEDSLHKSGIAIKTPNTILDSIKIFTPITEPTEL